MLFLPKTPIKCMLDLVYSTRDIFIEMLAVSNLSQSMIETTAGFVAGVTSTLVVHPLDIVKTRLQGNPVLA